MRIAFSSANAVEKKALATYVSEEFNLPLIIDLTYHIWTIATPADKDFLEYPNEIDSQTYTDFYNSLLRTNIFLETFHSKNNKGFVNFSCPYDFYARKLLRSNISLKNDDYNEIYLEERMSLYDVIFYIPNVTKKDDGVVSKRFKEGIKRSVDINIRQHLIEGTRSKMFGDKLCELSGNRKNKKKMISDVMSSKLYNMEGDDFFAF